MLRNHFSTLIDVPFSRFYKRGKLIKIIVSLSPFLSLYTHLLYILYMKNTTKFIKKKKIFSKKKVGDIFVNIKCKNIFENHLTSASIKRVNNKQLAKFRPSIIHVFQRNFSDPFCNLTYFKQRCHDIDLAGKIFSGGRAMLQA